MILPVRAKTFFIETHGCQMNEHDSEKISGLLIHRGLSPVYSLDEAELYVLNTCSVREKAEQKVYSRLGEVRRRKIHDRNFWIAVLGCVAQQEGEEMVNRAPYVDLVVGTHQFHTLPELLDDLEEKGSKTSVHTDFDANRTPVETQYLDRGSRFRANVTIMEGCNKHCAFCVVPYTRGPERNRPSKQILREIRKAADAGFVEILLLGQTVNSYKDPDRSTYKFGALLEDVAAVPGLRRIRYTSPHPRNFTSDIVQVIASHETICNHVHLPLQSGSSSVLKRMRRQHDRGWYMELVDQFRNCGRSVALSTDMIVGFPGESENEFEDTLSLVEWARFEQMFSFKYSVRPHTEAESWVDDISEEVKSRRLWVLQQLQRRIQMEVHQSSYLGREFEILVEGTAKDGSRRFGRTTTNKIVNYDGQEAPGEFIRVTITDVGPNSLIGEKSETKANLS
jgi:tRNA-2-methylthio-N6-dimethylallyladenosine synthase